MNPEKGSRQKVGQFRPNLCFYHANGKGTGSAAKMNLHPAHDDTDGSIMLTLANQMTVGNRIGPNPIYPTFDWENALRVKLDFTDLAQILQVLRGECESINDGKGLYHVSPRGATSIKLTHYVESVPGYMLDICRRTNQGGEGENHARIMLNPVEALGLCEALAGSLYLVCFGIPMLVPHDTSGYRAESKGSRDAVA